MIKNLLKRVFDKPSPKKDVPSLGKVVRVDLDKMGPDAQNEFAEVALQTSGLTFFEGRIEHGYSFNEVSTPQKCPRCQSPTPNNTTPNGFTRPR